jgi:hypothetical protein
MIRGHYLRISTTDLIIIYPFYLKMERVYILKLKQVVEQLTVGYTNGKKYMIILNGLNIPITSLLSIP